MGKVYRITTLGFEEKELAALKRILILSLKRDRAYKISENGSGSPDLILVNADVEAALAKVDQCVKDKDSVVYASRNPAGHEFPNILKLPFLGSAAIRMFDQIIILKTGEVREISISDDDHSDSTSYELDQVANFDDSPIAGVGQIKVLVLDDSASVRKQMEIVLRARKMIPVMAEDGERALELIQNENFDLAFLDVVLPGIDGYQVCKQIKKNRRFQHLPVVMLTSRSSPFDKVRGSLAGCDMYLTKPVSQDDFNNALKKCSKSFSQEIQNRIAL